VDKVTVNAFVVQPTIQWVASSTPVGAQAITVELDPGSATEKTFDFSIQAQGSDVLICGYSSFWNFDIVSQPVWNQSDWQPYDITGHGPGLDYPGPGSLQILAGQTVEFTGKIFKTSGAV
jgi:hypothetical protein